MVRNSALIAATGFATYLTAYYLLVPDGAYKFPISLLAGVVAAHEVQLEFLNHEGGW